MRIDYEQNPLAIVKRFDIPYGEDGDLHLEGRIYARGEEGLDEVNWFEGEVRYIKFNCEIGGTPDENYRALKRGATNLEEVEKNLRAWCKSMNLEISDVIIETKGLTV